MSTIPWIIQIRSWGTITTPSLSDFTQHATQEDTNFENSAQKAIGYAQTSDWTCPFVFEQL